MLIVKTADEWPKVEVGVEGSFVDQIGSIAEPGEQRLLSQHFAVQEGAFGGEAQG